MSGSPPRQDFADVDISMRRLVDRVVWASKLFGCPRPTIFNPHPRPWGLIILRDVEPKSFNDHKDDYQFAPIWDLSAWWFLVITKNLVSVFDTLQELEPAEFPPLEHIARKCLTCGKEHVTHI